MSNTKGYRGYIGSRPYQGQSVPQHVQNLVIRDFCLRHSFLYLLSATEYQMEGSYIMLEEILRDLAHINGIVMYSIFMLPKNRIRRCDFVERILASGVSLHGAVEGLSISTEGDHKRLEDLMALHAITTKNHVDFGAL